MLAGCCVRRGSRGLRMEITAAEGARWFATDELRAAERAWIDWCKKLRFGSVDHHSDARVLHVLRRLGFAVRNVEKKTLRRFDHPFIDALLRVRNADRMVSGIGKMQDAVGPGNRLRGVFDQIGTVTGRIVVRDLEPAQPPALVRVARRGTDGKPGRRPGIAGPRQHRDDPEVRPCRPVVQPQRGRVHRPSWQRRGNGRKWGSEE